MTATLSSQLLAYDLGESASWNTPRLVHAFDNGWPRRYGGRFDEADPAPLQSV